MAISKLNLGTLAPGASGYPAYAATVYSKLLEVADAMSIAKPTFSTIATGKGNPAGDITLAANTLDLVIDALNSSSGGSTGPLELFPTAVNLSQNGGIDEVQSDGRHRHASFARLHADFRNTTTTNIQVAITVVASALNRSVSVLLGDTPIATLANSAVGEQTFMVAVPGSSTNWRQLVLIEGAQDRDFEQGPIVGTTITKISLPTGSQANFVVVTPDNCLVVHGDSLSNGAETPTRQLQGWSALLRSITQGTVMTGYGSHTAFEAFSTPALRRRTGDQADASFVGALKKQELGFVITNDFDFGTWSPADMAAAYGAYYDMRHAEAPDVEQFVSTSLPRTAPAQTGTDTNKLGFKLAQYDAAIVTMASTRPWLRLIDGSKLVDASQLNSGGIHYGVQGHIDIANGLRAVLSSGGAAQGLSADVPYVRIIAAENGLVDYITKKPVLSVPAGRGVPSVVPALFGSKPGYNFVRAENDCYSLDLSGTNSIYFLLMAIVNIRSYESGNGMILSGLNGNGLDVFWSLSSSAGTMHTQGVAIAATVPTNINIGVAWFVTPDLKVGVRIGGDKGTTYYSPANAVPADGRGMLSALVGNYQTSGWAIDAALADLGLTLGQYTEAKVISELTALESYNGITR